MDKLQPVFDAILTFLVGLVPGALGAAVGVAYEKGLTWTDRFVQFSIGVIVSYFAGGVVAVLWPVGWLGPLDPFVLQGVTFSLGMVAFKATPRMASSLIDVLADLPGLIRLFIPKRKDGQ